MRISLKEIELWVDNDEGLYRWWRSSRLSKREFIRQNRDELRDCIRRVVTGEKKPHYLTYG